MAKREEWLKAKKRNFETALGDIVAGVINPVLDKASRVEAGIIANWNSIFDPSLRGKMSFKKLICTDKVNNRFTLQINVPVKYFLDVSYSEGVIREQLAVYMGYRAVDKVKIFKI